MQADETNGTGVPNKHACGVCTGQDGGVWYGMVRGVVWVLSGWDGRWAGWSYYYCGGDDKVGH